MRNICILHYIHNIPTIGKTIIIIARKKELDWSCDERREFVVRSHGG